MNGDGEKYGHQVHYYCLLAATLALQVQAHTHTHPAPPPHHQSRRLLVLLGHYHYK